MELLWLQILSGSGFCLGLFLWTMAPVLVAERSRSNAPNKLRRQRIQWGLSLANCFACGVFLATCFYGMIPHMRHHLEMSVVGQKNSSSGPDFWMDTLAYFHHNSTVELLLLIGFLLTVFLEELGHFCHRSAGTTVTRVHPQNDSGHRNKNGFDGVKSAVRSVEESEPLVSLSEAEGDGEEIDLNEVVSYDTGSPAKEDHHGHHHHHHLPLMDGSNLSFRSLALMFGLSVHNLFEGLALGLQDSPSQFLNVLLGISIHEVLCAFAFGISLAQQRLKIRTAVVIVMVYMSCVPLGMCGGIVMQFGKGSGSLVARVIMEGIAAGTFIYVATVEMFAAEFRQAHADHSEAHKCVGILKLFMVVLGCGCFIVLNVLSRS